MQGRFEKRGEVGILPGAGGTQRLPRLIGIEAALNAGGAESSSGNARQGE